MSDKVLPDGNSPDFWDKLKQLPPEQHFDALSKAKLSVEVKQVATFTEKPHGNARPRLTIIKLLHLGRQGKTRAQIAEAFGVTPHTVSKWCSQYKVTLKVRRKRRKPVEGQGYANMGLKDNLSSEWAAREFLADEAETGRRVLRGELGTEEV